MRVLSTTGFIQKPSAHSETFWDKAPWKKTEEEWIIYSALFIYIFVVSYPTLEGASAEKHHKHNQAAIQKPPSDAIRVEMSYFSYGSWQIANYSWGKTACDPYFSLRSVGWNDAMLNPFSSAFPLSPSPQFYHTVFSLACNSFWKCTGKISHENQVAKIKRSGMQLKGQPSYPEHVPVCLKYGCPLQALNSSWGQV